jgi:hypothetical protein
VSSTLHEFYAVQGTTSTGEARNPRCNSGPPTAGPSRPQAQWVLLPNQGQAERG